MDDAYTVQITRFADGGSELAEIIELSKEMARDDIDNVWWNLPNYVANPFFERDNHWTWEAIVNDYNQDALHACATVRSADGYLEGAMAYQFNAKSAIDSNLGTVYVGWLATAPRNRRNLVSNPLYKGVGTVLMYLAVRESYLSGLEGRISLQSLPTQKTLEFYEGLGFVRTDPNQPLSGLVDYELPQEAALTWLRSEGDLP